MSERNGKKALLRGVLHLWSETGTEGGYWAFQDERFIAPNSTNFSNVWSYDGLHVLKDGDELAIFSKENSSEVVWSGKISLHSLPCFSEHAEGFWIHADQNGIDRKTWTRWFFEQYPAELIPAE